MSYGQAKEKSLCGERDDRELSYKSFVGRMYHPDKETPCTATLIGRSCVITAGHCFPVFEAVEFDVPLSSQEGRMQRSLPENQFAIDKSSIELETPTGPETSHLDFAVMRLLPNKLTGLWPGDLFGHAELNFYSACPKTELEIIGHGKKSSDPTINFVQTRGWGELQEVKKEKLAYYTVDTTVGDSGAGIYQNGKLLGIHILGGCQRLGPGQNKGILFAQNKKLKELVKRCLKSEEVIDND